jgi:hypothetical protein
MANPIDDHDAITRVVGLYMTGASDGDVAKLRAAFHPDARMFGAVGGNRVDMAMEPFFDLSAALKNPLIYQTGPKTSGKSGCSCSIWEKRCISGLSQASRMVGSRS